MVSKLTQFKNNNPLPENLKGGDCEVRSGIEPL